MGAAATSAEETRAVTMTEANILNGLGFAFGLIGPKDWEENDRERCSPDILSKERNAVRKVKLTSSLNQLLIPCGVLGVLAFFG